MSKERIEQIEKLLDLARRGARLSPQHGEPEDLVNEYRELHIVSDLKLEPIEAVGFERKTLNGGW